MQIDPLKDSRWLLRVKILCFLYIEQQDIDLDIEFDVHLGIAHTRWATHGEPNPVNSHPQRSDKNNGELWVWSGSIFLWVLGMRLLSWPGRQYYGLFCRFILCREDRDSKKSKVSKIAELIILTWSLNKSLVLHAANS